MHLTFTTAFIYLLVLLPFIHVSAQEWTYEGSRDFRNFASDSWVDEYGNSYHNITHTSISKNKYGRTDYKYLLILDSNGKFNGMVHIKGCVNRSRILPFANGNFLSVGHNCNPDSTLEPDSRLFDRNGNLLRKGMGFSFSQINYVRTEEGYSLFFRNYLHSTMPTMEFRHIDWDFNIESNMQDLTGLMVPGKSLGTDPFYAPVQGTDGRWLFNAHHGTKQKDLGLSPEWSFVYLTDGDKIYRQFPKDQRNVRVRGMQACQDGYAVLLSEKNGQEYSMTVHILNRHAKPKRKIPVDVLPGQLDRFLVLPDRFIITKSVKDRQTGLHYILLSYDFDGNLLSERILHSNDKVNILSMLPFGDSGLLLAGSVSPSKTDRYAMIWKLDLSDNLSQKPSEDLPDISPQPASPIEEMSIDEVNDEVMSVAVYPNPASIYINFALENANATTTRNQLKVFSMNGRLMHQALLTHSFYELSIESFPPGTYSYQIINLHDKKEFIAGKFVKIE